MQASVVSDSHNNQIVVTFMDLIRYNSRQLKEGDMIPKNKLKYKKRLFSDIEYVNNNDGLTTVKKATHYIGLKDIIVHRDDCKLIVKSSNFYNSEYDLNFHQIMIYNYINKTIEFILTEPNKTNLDQFIPKIYYKSKYKIIVDPDTKKNKIVLDPYTTDKIIYPITYKTLIKIKLNSTKDGAVNVFKYIYDNSSNKVKIYDLTNREKLLEELNNNLTLIINGDSVLSSLSKMSAPSIGNSSTNSLNDEDNVKYGIYKSVKNHLKDVKRLNKHIEDLKKWKTTYNILYNTTKNIYNIDYKCIYSIKRPNIYKKNKDKNKNNEYKGYFSKKNVKLISLLNKYFDKPIELETDSIPILVREEQIIKFDQKPTSTDKKPPSTYKKPPSTDKKPPSTYKKQECKMVKFKRKDNKFELKEYGQKEPKSQDNKKNLVNKKGKSGYIIKPVKKFKSINHPIKTSKNIGEFGLYTPYLVSYILRDKPQSEKLNINENNIDKFCEFIHGFKSAGLSLISLLLQLIEINNNYTNEYNNMLSFNKKQKEAIKILNIRANNEYTRRKNLKRFNTSEHKEKPLNNIIIKFPYNKIYSISNDKSTYINHNIMINLDKNPNKIYDIKLNILIGELKENPDQVVKDLQFIELDEPFYGNSLHSNVDDQIEDFDQLFINKNTNTNTQNFFGNLVNSFTGDKLVRNIIKFNKKTTIVNNDSANIFAFNIDTDFPLLSYKNTNTGVIIQKNDSLLNKNVIFEITEGDIKELPKCWNKNDDVNDGDVEDCNDDDVDDVDDVDDDDDVDDVDDDVDDDGIDVYGVDVEVNDDEDEDEDYYDKFMKSVNDKYNSSVNDKYNSSVNDKYQSSVNEEKYNRSINDYDHYDEYMRINDEYMRKNNNYQRKYLKYKIKYMKLKKL